MSHSGICRVCLSSNLKLHSIENTLFQKIYEKLTSCKLNAEHGHPNTVCYICHTQLQTCLWLLDKSQKSKDILTQLFDCGIKISQETVAALNRRIQHDFCVTRIEVYSSDNETKATVKQENVSVKEEFMYVKKTQRKNETILAEPVLCRICLAGNVRTCTIRNTPLQVIYENLTDTKLISEEAKHDVVCYICHWQLLKCRKFTNRAKKSLKILNELFRNGIQLTQDTINIFSSQMKPNYMLSPVVFLSHCCHGNFCKENVIPQDTTKTNVVERTTKAAPTYTESAVTSSDEESNDVDMFCDKTALKELTCKVCNHKTKTVQQMKKHLLLHDPDRRHVCDLCSYRFTTSSSVIDHKLNVHKTTYPCLKCNKKFKRIRQLNMHMLIHSDNPVYKCDKCSKVFKISKTLQVHYRRNHPELYLCKKCCIPFDSEQKLRDHIRNIHAQLPKYICDVCNKTFRHKQNMKQHLGVHDSIKPYECDFCCKTFRSKHNLAMHIMNHTGYKPFICKVCDKTFRSNHLLNLHTITHTKKRYTCGICSEQYTRKQILVEHIQTHKTGVKNRYTCQQCGNVYKLKTELKIHMYSHKYPRVETPYVTCNVCHKQIKSLKEHMKTHTQEKFYICDICGKYFARRGNFVQHLRVHAGIKPFACDKCGRYFIKKEHLKVHLLTHSGVKPYKCEECDNSYAIKSSLKTHMKKHKNEIKIFSCDQCNNTFTDMRSLKCHRYNKHNSEKKYYICDACFKVYTIENDFITHLKTHEKTIKFSCDGCTQTFTEIGTLAKHMKTHVSDKKLRCTLCDNVVKRRILYRHYLIVHGVKPYACNICEEKFVHIPLLYRHYMQSHLGTRPYICKLCSQSFAREYSLKRHNRKFHFITSK